MIDSLIVESVMHCYEQGACHVVLRDRRALVCRYHSVTHNKWP